MDKLTNERTNVADGFADFWAWWHDSRSTITDSLAERDMEHLAAEVTQHVHAIDPRLSWEIGPGHVSEYVLIVSSGGDPDVRALARRWRKSAPPADAQWSYSDLRLPSPQPSGNTLTIGEVEISIGDLRFLTRTDRASIDVLTSHPSFASMPAKAAAHLAFMGLDQILGEEVVESWVGVIDVANEVPSDGLDANQLRRLFDDHRAEHLTEDGSPAWAVLEGETPEGPLVARVQIPLRPATAPEFDTYAHITVSYPDAGNRGFPNESQQSLYAAEDQIDTILGGNGRVVAVETGHNQKEWHCYLDAESDVLDRLLEWATASGAEAHSQHDPAWKCVDHLA